MSSKAICFVKNKNLVVVSTLKKFAGHLVKFIYCEKATKFYEISTLILSVMYCRQKQGGDFAKFCGLLRIYELYCKVMNSIKSC